MDYLPVTDLFNIIGVLMKVFSVSGYHQTGKTTVSIALIKELKKRGYRVVSIKDIHFEQFTMEKEGSNSWEHLMANDEVVFARGLKSTYQIWNRPLTLNEMLEHLNADYIIVEGMQDVALPRIICAESEEQLRELVDGTVFAISGIYSNYNIQYLKIPVLHPLKQIEELTDLVEKKVFEVLPLPKKECCGACGMTCREMVTEILAGRKTREDCKTDRKLGTHLKVAEKEIKIVPFVQKAFHDTILGFVRNLKGCEKGKIEIVIDD